MVWEAERDGRVSRLVGTAHFIPWSFRSSLERLIREARIAYFEGPLEPEAMARVREAGTGGPGEQLFDALPPDTARGVSEALFPACRTRRAQALLGPLGPGPQDPARSLVAGMKPWLAFFTLWSTYLEKLGWRHSVDFEAYRLAKEMQRPLSFLESIEEQIEVLESLPLERIHRFLAHHEQWRRVAGEYAKSYARGDLGGIRWLSLGFPTRHQPVIGPRDRLFFERAAPDLEEGGALLFVGAPHIPGLVELLTGAGYRVQGPPQG
jgi:hypothetical protein